MSHGDDPSRSTRAGSDDPTAAAGAADLGPVEEILRGAGVHFRRVSRQGSSGDVLAVDADPAELERVRACAPRVRGLGFRYVAVELRPEGPIARPDGPGVSGEPATRLT